MSLLVRDLGHTPYEATFRDMQAFTAARTAATPDELWMCEHPPTFTQGLAGDARHLIGSSDIPLVASDRGGQVTFHGPGQVVAYPLVDLQRAGYFVKEYVYRLEESIIRTLGHWQVTGHRVAGAPGIYVRLDDPFAHQPLPQRPQAGQTRLMPDAFSGLGKIAALGIKVSRHCTYHGAALNVAMDLSAYELINPCGYAGLKTVDLSTIGVSVAPGEFAELWANQLQRLLP
jgi:lipoyl(octanoyl) transferase